MLNDLQQLLDELLRSLEHRKRITLSELLRLEVLLLMLMASLEMFKRGIDTEYGLLLLLQSFELALN